MVPTRTALIVVDMQYDFIGPDEGSGSSDGRKMLPRLIELIEFCRAVGIKVIYTKHVHRADGSDAGIFARLWPRIAEKAALVEGTEGVEIVDEIRPLPGEPVIEKHRYSAFFGTDLEILLRCSCIDTVAISGVTTENCCESTARDAVFRDFSLIFLSDCTATHDYPDVGFGPMTADEIHRAQLTVIGTSFGHVMTSSEFKTITCR